MAVTFGTPVKVDLTSGLTSVVFVMPTVVSGQPIAVAVVLYPASSPSGISDDFPTPYTWTAVGPPETSSGGSIQNYLGTGGAGTSGTVTVAGISTSYAGGVAVPCIGASTAAGLAAIDVHGGSSTPTLSLIPGAAGEGAFYAAFTAYALAGDPSSPWVNTHIALSGTEYGDVATYASPASGSALAVTWTSGSNYVTAGLIVKAAPPPLAGTMAWSFSEAASPLLFLTLVPLTGESDWSFSEAASPLVPVTLVPLAGTTGWSVDCAAADLLEPIFLAGTSAWSVSEAASPLLFLTVASLTGESDWSIDFDPAACMAYLYLSNWKEITVPDPGGGAPTTRKLVYGPNISVDFVPILDLLPGSPDTPTGLGAAVVGDGNEVLVVWKPNHADGITYTLEGSNNGTTWTQLAALYDQFVFDEAGLGYSVTRYYTLRASNPYGTSGYCTPVVVTTLAAPPIVPISPFVPPHIPSAAIRRVVVTGGIVIPGGMV